MTAGGRLGRLGRSVGLASAALFAVAAGAQAQAGGAPASATAKPDTGHLTGERGYRSRKPIRAFPLLEYERFDRAAMGTDPTDPDLARLEDLDVLWPLFGWRREERDARGGTERSGSLSLFPLVWNAWDPRGSDTVVLPLGYYGTRGDAWSAFLLPGLGYAHGGPDGWEGSALWPLVSAGAHRDDWWFRVAPLLFAGGGPVHSRLALLPLFWWERQRQVGLDVFASPLVVHVGTARESYTSVTPLYHRYRRTGGDPLAVDVCLPFGWRQATGANSAVVTPLVIHAEGRHQRYTMATPLLHHWRRDATDPRGPAALDLLIPFLLRSRSTRHDLTVVLPVGAWWRDANTSLDVLGPLWSYSADHGKRTAGGLFPLVWRARDEGRNRSSLTVVPFWHASADATSGTRQRLIVPIAFAFENPRERFAWIAPANFAYAEKASGFRVAAALPFFYHQTARTGGPSGTIVAPFYGGWRGRDGSALDVVAPFFWRWSDPRVTRWFALPALYHEARGSRTATVGFPLWWDFADPEAGRRTTLAIPFGFHREAPGTQTTLLGPWFSHDDPARRIRYLFPFYGQARSGTRTRHHLAAPLLSWETDDTAGLRSVDLCWPLVAASAEGERRHQRLLPLYWSTRENAAGDGLDIAFPAYAAYQRGATRYTHLLPFFADYRGASGLRWTSILGPTVVLRGRDVPPSARPGPTEAAEGFTYRTAAPESWKAVDVMGGLFHWGAQGDRSKFRALPFGFGDQRPGGHRFAFLPGLWHQTRGDVHETLALPFFARHASPTEQHVLGPFCWARNGPGIRERVLFPFLWDIEHPQRVSRHVAPFFGYDQWRDRDGRPTFEQWTLGLPSFRAWRDHRRDARGFDIAWPLVAWQQAPESAHARIAPFLFWWRWADEWTGVLLPLGAAAGTPDGWTVLAPLFFGQKDRETTRLTLFPCLWWFDEPAFHLRGLWPLAGWSWRTDAQGATRRVDVSMAWPLIQAHWDRDADRTEVSLAGPLACAGSERGNAYAWCAPLAYYDGRDGSQFELAPATGLPIGSWLHRGDEAFAALAWPFGPTYGRSGDRVHARCLPLFWYDTDGRKSFGLAPLSHWWREDQRSSWSLLFPLLYGASDGQDRWAFRFGWELFVARQRAADDFEWRVLGRLMHYRSRGSERILEVKPFFYWESDGKGTGYLSLLLGTLAFNWRPDETRATLFGVIDF